MLKVDNRNTKTRCKICSKLTIKTREQCHQPRSGVFIVNFVTYFTPCSSVSIANFEQVNAGWGTYQVNPTFDMHVRLAVQVHISTVSKILLVYVPPEAAETAHFCSVMGCFLEKQGH